MTEIWIRGQVPSKKNTKMIVRGRLVNSPTVVKWQKLSAQDWLKNKELFRTLVGSKCPAHIHLTFIRDSERLFDLTAPAETLQDEMVKYNYVNDDNYCELVIYFGKTKIDRKNPGVIIKVLAEPPKYTFL